MAVLLVSLLCLLAAGAVNAQSAYIPFCDPSDYADSPSMPLPSFPEQFSTVVEANIGQRNLTMVVEEYYDDVGNMGKMVFSYNDTEGTGIFDYDNQEVFLIPDRQTGSPCAVRRIAEPDQLINRTFGFRYENGSVHIGSVQNLFGIHSDRPMNYTGTAEARGIPTNTWQTCFAEENNSYVLTYHFATEDWAYAHEVDSLPVQITLEGRRISGDGELIEIDHVYSFVDFNDVVSDEDFRVPIGLPCKGRIPGPAPPAPSLPDYFSMYIEVENFDRRASSLVTEYYDYDHNLFRIDLYYDGRQGGIAGPYSVILNFDIEVGYFINRQFSNCSAFALRSNESFYESVIGDDGNLRLKSPRNLFFLSNEFNYSYEGVTTVRGVEVDAWIAFQDQVDLGRSNLSNAIIEWFFTRPGWEVETNVYSTTEPSPWRLKLSGIVSYMNESSDTVVTEDFNREYDIIGFSAVEPGFDVFDTSVCVSPGDSHILSMIIPGHEAGVTNLGQIRKNVRAAITEYARINPLQVGNIEFVGENGTHLFVTVYLSSLPDVAMTTTTPRTASNILELILNNTEDDQLPFQVSIGPGPAVYPTLLHVNPECMTPCSCDPCECEDDDVSVGGVAGLILVVLVIGIILGVILALVVGLVVKFCCRRRRPAVLATVKYEKQEDDL